MKIQDLKKYKIPDKPGVYFFFGTPKPREGGLKSQLLYIGKATSLKDRVKSYFGKDLFNTRGPLIVDMVTKANDLKWVESESVLEALILETNLIKKHQPYYNTKEKDDKSFNYVCITNEEFPKVLIVRGKDLAKKKDKFSVRGSHLVIQERRRTKISPSFSSVNGSLNSSVSFSSVFGPFPNGGQLKEALKIIRKIFPFLDEKSKNNYEFYKQIKLVPEQKEILLKNIKNIKLFFEGKKQKIIKDLEKEMKVCAKKHAFEKAGEIKKQIFALKHINDISLIKNSPENNSFVSVDDKIFNPAPFSDYRVGPSDIKISSSTTLSSVFRIESYDIAHMSGKDMVGVMTVLEDGEIKKSDYRKFKIKNYKDANDTGALLEVLERRFAHPEWIYPDLIVVDGGIAQINVAKKFQVNFAKLHKDGKKIRLIPIVSVLKDERHKPKNILGDKRFVLKYKRDILLANNEAHRFAISFHRKLRDYLRK
jgi:excinuclease ABC subunit C